MGFDDYYDYRDYDALCSFVLPRDMIGHSVGGRGGGGGGILTRQEEESIDLGIAAMKPGELSHENNTNISTRSLAIEESDSIFNENKAATTTSSKESNGFRVKDDNTQRELPVIFDYAGVLERADNATSGSAITTYRATKSAVLISRNASTSSSNKSTIKEATSPSRQSKYITSRDYISEHPVLVTSRDGMSPSKYNSNGSKHPAGMQNNWPVIALPPPTKPRKSAEATYGGNLVHMATIKNTAEPMKDMRDTSRSKTSIRKRIWTRLLRYIKKDKYKEAAL